jgi:hypothetical protein
MRTMSVLRVPPDVRSPSPPSDRDHQATWRPGTRDAWLSRYCLLWLLAAPFAGPRSRRNGLRPWTRGALGALEGGPPGDAADDPLRRWRVLRSPIRPEGLPGRLGEPRRQPSYLWCWRLACRSGSPSPADSKRAASTCIASPASVSRLVTGRAGSPRWASRHGFPVATNSRRQAFNELRWGLPLPPFIAVATSTTNRLRIAKILRTPPRSNTAATARAFRATRTAIISRLSLTSCPAAIVLSFPNSTFATLVAHLNLAPNTTSFLGLVDPALTGPMPKRLATTLGLGLAGRSAARIVCLLLGGCRKVGRIRDVRPQLQVDEARA